jgi:hypothetical protein
MTATEELRRLLDERVVEWHDTKIGKGFITVYEHDGITWVVTEHSSGRLSVKGCVKPTQGHYDGMTPAQAIAAICHDKKRLDSRFVTVFVPEIGSWEFREAGLNELRGLLTGCEGVCHDC